jgi:uncharacterized protein (DUF433 family)
MLKEYVEQRDGGYYLSGTRVSLDSMVHAFHRGESPETICQNFDALSLEVVYGAIAYYLANQPAVDGYLKNQESKWREGRQNAAPLSESLRQRLAVARSGLHASNQS